MPTYDPPIQTMQVSQRIRNLKPSATLAVNAVVQRLRAEGRDIIGFGAGEPDFETPDNIKQAAIDALGRGETHYMPVPGAPAARQAIADKLRDENGIACGPDDIVITVGGKHALFMIFQCLLDADKGQEVIVPTPAWVSYRPQIELAGGTVGPVTPGQWATVAFDEGCMDLDLEKTYYLSFLNNARTMGLAGNADNAYERGSLFAFDEWVEFKFLDLAFASFCECEQPPRPTCVYKTRKIVQKKCRQSGCPFKQVDCQIATRKNCSDVGDCRKSIKQRSKCTDPNEPGKCKHILDRCNCT